MCMVLKALEIDDGALLDFSNSPALDLLIDVAEGARTLICSNCCRRASVSFETVELAFD